MGVALGLIGLIAAIAIPSANSLMGVKLKTTASMLTGLMREAYTEAAITGKVHRIVLNMDQRAYWLERTDEAFVLGSTKLEADHEGRARVPSKRNKRRPRKWTTTGTRFRPH